MSNFNIDISLLQGQIQNATQQYVALNSTGGSLTNLINNENSFQSLLNKQESNLLEKKQNLEREKETEKRFILLNENSRKKNLFYISIITYWIIALSIILILLIVAKRAEPFGVISFLFWLLFYILIIIGLALLSVYINTLFSGVIALFVIEILLNFWNYSYGMYFFYVVSAIISCITIYITVVIEKQIEQRDPNDFDLLKINPPPTVSPSKVAAAAAAAAAAPKKPCVGADCCVGYANLYYDNQAAVCKEK